MASTVSINLIGLMKHLTKCDWSYKHGPDTGCGLDYWLEHDGDEAYVNIDQEFITISINGEWFFDGNLDDATCSPFVTEMLLA